MNTIIHTITIKMKPTDEKSSTSIDFGVKINDKDSKFEVAGHVRIWKYEKIFQIFKFLQKSILQIDLKKFL